MPFKITSEKQQRDIRSYFKSGHQMSRKTKIGKAYLAIETYDRTSKVLQMQSHQRRKPEQLSQELRKLFQDHDEAIRDEKSP